MPAIETKRLAEFYAHLDGMHREFFSVLLRAWIEAGQVWHWHEQGVALCLRSSSGHVPVIYLLCGRGRRPAVMLLPLKELLPRLGQEHAEAIVRRFTAIHGLVWRRHEGDVQLLAPAHASGPVQQALRNAVRALAVDLAALLAR